MAEEKKVKDIMVPIEEYDKIDIDSQLCDALSILKRNYETLKNQGTGSFHKTLFVIDGDDKIVGKLSMYDLIRSLVPEPAKAPEISKAYHAMLSSRSLEVVEEVSDFQEHFKWLSSTFCELVKQEAHKKVRDVMNPLIESVLIEEDKNKPGHLRHVQRRCPPAIDPQGKKNRRRNKPQYHIYRTPRNRRSGMRHNVVR